MKSLGNRSRFRGYRFIQVPRGNTIEVGEVCIEHDLLLPEEKNGLLKTFRRDRQSCFRHMASTAWQKSLVG